MKPGLLHEFVEEVKNNSEPELSLEDEQPIEIYGLDDLSMKLEQSSGRFVSVNFDVVGRTFSYGEDGLMILVGSDEWEEVNDDCLKSKIKEYIVWRVNLLHELGI